MNNATFLSELGEHLIEIANTYFSHTIIILILSNITGFALWFKARKEWKKSKFEGRINISLNTVDAGVLRIRTLIEAPVKDVVLSAYARKLMKKASRRTTLKNEFLCFDDEKDSWLVYNEIRNTISGLYSEQLISAAIRGKKTEEKFLIALTWERDSETFIQKIRVLMIQESLLNRIHWEHVNPEVPWHAARLKALVKVKEQLMVGKWPRHQTVLLPRV